ncbi:predicted protein [Plenodomus lingam JN3]|uniref:Predicted protein n=1 Tax=Leptosphaeria maculans (strain JN3 / isolate v23.1.3 / race Av1-4-5-6-7-8) TaxID=985895 RepID=E5R575_LEPMJ|nr:predicted protein [Plenodomus lingam JN3]CBX92045.1 predicted protein [Plenodomus lingam JN3]
MQTICTRFESTYETDIISDIHILEIGVQVPPVLHMILQSGVFGLFCSAVGVR